MKVMYIMPRYHTNLIPTVNGWLTAGHEVRIVTADSGRIEDYSLVSPIVIGYAGWNKFFMNLYSTRIKKNDPMAADIRLRWGIPSKKRVKRELSEFKPDLVILREKSMYSIWCNQVCRRMKIKTIIYNQSPVWAESSFFKHDIPHRIVNSLVPHYRITPVNQVGNCLEGKISDETAKFAPFVMNRNLPPSEKQHFIDGYINILEIGKYEKRKNHFMMIDVFARIHSEIKDTKLTIVGEKSTGFHEMYYNKIQEYVEKKGLSDCVSLFYNKKREEMAELYKKTDLFVLASTGEPAAISHIEAMSYSVPAICSTGNGTADYITKDTGDIFEDKNEDDLFNKMKNIVSDRNRLINMGANAYNRISEHCSFEKYYSAVTEQMEKLV